MFLPDLCQSTYLTCEENSYGVFPFTSPSFNQQPFSNSYGSAEQALNEVCTELAALEVQDAALYQQIIQETGKLCQLEEKVRHMLCHYLGSLTLPNSGCVYL